MAFGLIVQMPVSVAFGTDEEFDLRCRLERELAGALRATGAGECSGGEIDTSHMKLYLDGVTDTALALDTVKPVLARNGLLNRATVILETCCPNDPDERAWDILWTPQHAVVSGVY